MSDRAGLNRILFWLYEGTGRAPFLFRWLLLLLDIATILYFVTAPFEYREAHHLMDYAIGSFYALDLVARFYIVRRKTRFLSDWMNWVDLVLVATCFVPFLASNFAFLRILRLIRAIRRFTFIRHKGEVWSWVTRNERVIDRVMNLVAFVFIAAAVVYATQNAHPKINSYFDALYFTVTTLTSTGYGDITMETPFGRLLSMVMMVLGLTLFLRLVAALFNPHAQVVAECQACHLERHDEDAVHCKRCGGLLHLDASDAKVNRIS
jgi:voltage-gated potassium channel